MKIDKRKCRKYAEVGLKMNRNCGMLHAEGIKHIIRTAVKNIGGHRMLVMYVYPREKAASGAFTPRGKRIIQRWPTGKTEAHSGEVRLSIILAVITDL